MFDVKTTNGFNKNAIEIKASGDFDFIGRSSLNNGIQGKCSRQIGEPNPKETFSLVQVGESVCLYRENEWYASQNVFILMPRNEHLKKTHLYIQGTVNKVLQQKYREAYVYPKLSDVKELGMVLPVVSDGTPDYHLMEIYIRALEKIAINRVNEADIICIRQTRKVVYNA